MRWQSHWHVIRQSWTFFQNDFAGRIGNKVIQAGEALEITVNLTIDAVWYAAVFVVVAVVVLAGMDPVLLVPIAVWLALYAALFAWSMPRITRFSEEVSEAKSVMTGRMVDSYTNIQTLKTFAVDGHEDAYVAASVDRPRGGVPQADAGLHRQLVAPVPPERGAGGGGHLARARGLERRHHDRGDGRDRDPVRLQIMNISGWILEIGSNVFRQIGTARDSMQTIARPLTLVDAPGASELVVPRGEIVYDRVGFDYWRGDAGAVLRDFSLTVAPGEKIGLVGRSGRRQVDARQPDAAALRRRARARSASTARTCAT